ncbi:hypothetical protein KPL70_001041 [Citrus sinensis]|nr:hypothetical protein KPL70_001041 [Citrus sinensis]
MDQRVENIEKSIESLTTSQNEILSQISLMFERLNARIDQISSQAANDKAEDSSTPQRVQRGHSNGNDNTPQASSSHCYALKLVKLDFPRFDVSLASFHLESDAQLWYQLLKQEAVYISWNEFKEWLHSRYGPNKFLDFFGELTKLQQSGSVEEYQSKFEKLLAKVEHLSQARQVSCFISGLCESIRIDVQTNRPDSLTSAIGLARLYEAREFSRRKSSVDVKRVLNLIVPGHRCKMLFLIQASFEDSNENVEMEIEGDEAVEQTETATEISFHAMVGTQTPEMMGVMGRLVQKVVTILIDSGSTHNFVRQEPAERVGLQPIPIKQLNVMVASGERLSSLGTQWLSTLGPIEWDFSKLVIMASNKERIEALEAGLDGVQDGMHQLELGENNGGRQIFYSKMARLEFPKYSGEDPTEWLSRVAQFFEFQGIADNQKVTLASFHLEGEANQWWQWMRRTYQEEGRSVTWEFFEEELWARFGPTECEDFDEALSRVRQVGSLRDYQKEFERLVNRVHGWTQKALVGTFMGGLKPEIADGIRMFKPKTLKEAISLSRMRDEQIARTKRFTRPPLLNRVPTTSTTMNRSNPTATPKRLSWDEMQKRRTQGLCFNCNEKFTPRHKCQGPQLLLLECPSSNQTKEYEMEDRELQRAETPEDQVEPEISLHALTGWTSPQTMRVTATIGSQHVMVLIDSGSTHNFLSERVARLIRLPVIPTKSFAVRVANGERLTCQGRFEEVQVNLQGITFSLTLYSLPLAGLDIVLGIQWLEMLGSMVCNWKQLTMDFHWDNQARRLQGINQTIQATSLTSVAKEMRQGQMMFAIYLHNAERSTWADISPNMQQTLKDYADVFKEPTTLPPLRDIDHHIPLKEGTQPINVRPYRYAYFQKAEIEKQVHEMLNMGIIRPSTSPFSSPVLLVKKKDGTWRFCTDYRVLNAATIKDRFPIPTVDDMLDELYGAAYFTKLDLRAGYHQVRVHASDIPKTAFRTYNGHFEYLVMPFGLCNAPSTFQAIMNSIFHPHLRKFILVFFDDILVYSPTWELHIEHVRTTLDILRQHQFFIKGSKCDFGKQELEYLGHIVTHQGVKVDNNKIEAMVAWPQPANITELRGFLGLTGDGIGAVLTQQGQPIAFMSRALGISKRAWSIYAKEMLAIVEAIQTWRPYLLGRKFFIRTDHRSLKYFLDQRVATPEQQK